MLYQKVRPTKLQEIRGNNRTVEALRKLLERPESDRPHAFIIHGPSGCGKTTVARILCSEFGCEEIIELNAANTRGIDTIREIEEACHFHPLHGGAKGFILDESHQLTPAAQEALLKILEETPSHVYFFLCTTELATIIPTIRNRCAMYEMCRLSQEDIVQILLDATEKEKIKVDDSLLATITECAEGSPRRALVLLEQTKDLPTDEGIQALLAGTEKDTSVIELCKLLYMNPSKRRDNWKKILHTFDKIEGDPETIRKSILTFLYRRLLDAESIDEAEDLSNIIFTLSKSVFYGSKAQLGALISQVCLGRI